HLSMQAAAQKHIDSSISKTINCPPDMPFEDFKDVYSLAYTLGLKGCTTYRPSGVRGAVLSRGGKAEPEGMSDRILATESPSQTGARKHSGSPAPATTKGGEVHYM